MTLHWVGLFLCLNSTQPMTKPPFSSVPAAEVVTTFTVNKVSVTSIFIQPMRSNESRLTSFSIGWRLF